jgi:PAT family beta-lactamase induction signal transducer AmpG
LHRVFRHKLTLLSALYFVEGIPWGFQSQALPIYLRTHHESLAFIGLVNSLSLPWMCKTLWAPCVDRFGSTRFGRRKSWIVPCQVALALCCLGAAHASVHGALALLLGLVFLMNACAATMDIAVDALAVDVLKEHELGTGNITQVVGYKVGSLVSGGLLVWATAAAGWGWLFVWMAALVGAVALITFFVREPTAQSEGNDHDTTALPLRDIIHRVRGAMSRRGTVAFLAFIATYKLGEQLVDSMFKPFLVDSGFSAAQVGLWVGTFGMLASLTGSFLGGFLASHGSPFRAVAVSAVLRLLPLIAVFGLTLGHPTESAVIWSTIAEHFFGGLLTTAVFAYMMGQTDRRVGATHYTLLANIEMLGKAPVPMVAGVFAQVYGYSSAWAPSSRSCSCSSSSRSAV